MKTILITVLSVYSTFHQPQKIEDVVFVQPKHSIEWVEMVEGVKLFESYRSKPYVCAGGRLTIGYGHTGGGVKLGYVSKKKATELLQKDLEKYKNIVLDNVDVPLTDGQLASLTSFTMNCGGGNLRQLVDGDGRLNNGNYSSVERVLPLYRRSKGKILNGLVKRRAWELKLWKDKQKPIAKN